MIMKTKKFFVDVLALNLFIFCSAFFVEVVFSGIALGVFLKGRALMVIPNIIFMEIDPNWVIRKGRKH